MMMPDNQPSHSVSSEDDAYASVHHTTNPDPDAHTDYRTDDATYQDPYAAEYGAKYGAEYHTHGSDDIETAHAILAEDEIPPPIWSRNTFMRLLTLFIILTVLAAFVVYVFFPLLDLWLNPPPPPPLPPASRL